MDNRKRSFLSPEVLWYLLVFAFFFIWFTQIHPLTVFDGDDWLYVSFSRTALPIWGFWNPSRVFPEIFMPLCSSVAAYAVYPLIGNYLQAMTLTHGFVVALFLTLYTWSFLRMMKRLFQISDATAVFSCAFFLIGHFLIFRSELTDNTYMLFCYDLTCYYYYLIPAVVNASLIMWMLGNPGFLAVLSPVKKGLLFLVLYLAVFSNLPDSGILAAYAGSVVLLRIIRHCKEKTSWQSLFRETGLYLAILGMWLVSAVFELSGGRAASFAGTLPFPESLRYTVNTFPLVLCYSNRVFLVVCTIITAAAVVVLAMSRRSAPEDETFGAALPLCLIAIAAMTVYTLVLCAAVLFSHIWRSEYLFGLFFFIMLLVSLSFGYLLKKQPRALYAVPILLCILFFECTTESTAFQDSTCNCIDPAICNEITQDMIDTLLQAEEAGLSEVTLEVPVFAASDNWPIMDTYFSGRLVNTLYKHNVLRRRLTVTIVPSAERNIEYCIPLPE